jgi:hypothetical protein
MALALALAAALATLQPAGAGIVTSCLKLLARYRPERIHSIATVPGCGRAARDAYCARIHTSVAIDASGLELRSGELEILFESPRSDAGPIPPARVQVRPAPPDPDLGH